MTLAKLSNACYLCHELSLCNHACALWLCITISSPSVIVIYAVSVQPVYHT